MITFSPPVPVFVCKACAISADPELSQELPKALFDLTAFHSPFIPNAFSSAEAVAVINSGIIKSRHFPLRFLRLFIYNKKQIKLIFADFTQSFDTLTQYPPRDCFRGKTFATACWRLDSTYQWQRDWFTASCTSK